MTHLRHPPRHRTQPPVNERYVYKIARSLFHRSAFDLRCWTRICSLVKKYYCSSVQSCPKTVVRSLLTRVVHLVTRTIFLFVIKDKMRFLPILHISFVCCRYISSQVVSPAEVQSYIKAFVLRTCQSLDFVKDENYSCFIMRIISTQRQEKDFVSTWLRSLRVTNWSETNPSGFLNQFFD